MSHLAGVRRAIHADALSNALQTHRGDLYVSYSVAFPKALSQEQKAAVRREFPLDTPFVGLGDNKGHDEL